MTWLKQKVITTVVLLILVLISSCSILTQPGVEPILSNPPTVSSIRLEQHVRFLSETVHPRNFQEQHNLNAAADYIHQQLKETGANVTEQIFEVDGQSYRNISAYFGPQQGPVMIIGAHYDSYADTPGADDNASGVAGLLELALLLKDTPPKHAVELVAYTLEEPPLFRPKEMGSAIHASSLKKTNRPVSLMITLEMIGYFTAEANSQKYPLSFLNSLYPDTGDFIAVIGRLSDISETRKVKALMAGATELPVYSINAPALIEGLDFSDHLNYWSEGFNAVMITNTAFFRNTQYHQLDDTAERLDYQRMAKVVQGVYAVVQGYNDQ